MSAVQQLADSQAFQNLRDEIIGLAQLRPGDTVLDIGAGTGLLTLAAAREVHHVAALDISPAMCRYLRQRVAEYGLSNVDVVVGNAAELPLPDASVDVVISNYCLHHLNETEKRESLREVARVLTPEGRVVIGDMMFTIGLRSARDRAVVLSVVRRLLRRGPAGLVRLARNALRVIAGRAEHPASAAWWQQALTEAGFTHVGVRTLSHEGGLACAHSPSLARGNSTNARNASTPRLFMARLHRPTAQQRS